MAVVCVPVVVVPVFQKVETVDSLSELSTEMASDAEHSHVPPPCSDVKSGRVCGQDERGHRLPGRKGHIS